MAKPVNKRLSSAFLSVDCCRALKTTIVDSKNQSAHLVRGQQEKLPNVYDLNTAHSDSVDNHRNGRWDNNTERPGEVSSPMAWSSSNPALTNAGYIMPPIAMTVTGEEPLIAAKSTQPPMAAIARPPGIQSVKAVAREINRLAIPPLVMIAPLTTKNGIAKRTALSVSSKFFQERFRNHPAEYHSGRACIKRSPCRAMKKSGWAIMILTATVH